MTEEEWDDYEFQIMEYSFDILDKMNVGKISSEKSMRLVDKLDEWEDEYYRRKKELNE